MLDALRQAAAAVAYSKPEIDIVANLTGQVADEHTFADPCYWSRHARSPVRFAQSMQVLAERGCEIFLEIGPSPTLIGMGRRCLMQEESAWLPSLRPRPAMRNAETLKTETLKPLQHFSVSDSQHLPVPGAPDDWQSMLDSLGQLYVRGRKIDWAGFDRPYPRRRVSLPTYPFQRKRYWAGSAPDASSASVAGSSANGHEVASVARPPLDRRRAGAGLRAADVGASAGDVGRSQDPGQGDHARRRLPGNGLGRGRGPDPEYRVPRQALVRPRHVAGGTIAVGQNAQDRADDRHARRSASGRRPHRQPGGRQRRRRADVCHARQSDVHARSGGHQVEVGDRMPRSSWRSSTWSRSARVSPERPATSRGGGRPSANQGSNRARRSPGWSSTGRTRKRPWASCGPPARPTGPISIMFIPVCWIACSSCSGRSCPARERASTPTCRWPSSNWQCFAKYHKGRSGRWPH